MTGPVRIQRQRARGWRMPEGAVYVGRPSRWGNPFDVLTMGQEGAVQAFVVHLAAYFGWEERAFHPWPVTSRAMDDWLSPLRDATALACWCPLVDAQGQAVPCHADVLIELLAEP